MSSKKICSKEGPFVVPKPPVETMAVKGANSKRGRKRKKLETEQVDQTSSTSTLSVLKTNESKEMEDPGLMCPVCLSVFKQPMVVKCGHTFCHDCILRYVEEKLQCPSCRSKATKTDIAPNFTVNDLVVLHEKRRLSREQLLTSASKDGRTSNFSTSKNLAVEWSNSITSLSDVDLTISLLQRRRESLALHSKAVRNELTVVFLKDLESIKLALQRRLEQELKLIKHDIELVRKEMSSVSVLDSDLASVKAPATQVKATSSQSSGMESIGSQKLGSKALPLPSTSKAQAGGPSDATNSLGFNTQQLSTDVSSLALKKKRLNGHFVELTNLYLSTRKSQLFDEPTEDVDVPSGDTFSTEALENFSQTLHEISQYQGLKPLASLNYSADILAPSNIASSIEFDKNGEFFSVAGTSGKIKIFEYSAVLASAMDYQFPNCELIGKVRVSSTAFNGYFQNKLISSDYDGAVSLWDTGVATPTRIYSEHDKRVWSVDWSNSDPRMFASGSDDSKIRIWSSEAQRSVAVIEAAGNVCSVKFSPYDPLLLAAGSADKGVHLYDLRRPVSPLCTLRGHAKTVSHVRFMARQEIVSASTDNQLRLWNYEDVALVRTYQGHTNIKNFVGLATEGNFIACGSEDNSVYIYGKALPKPLFSFKFQNYQSMLGAGRSDNPSNEFISSVTWKKGSPVVLGANSQGAIKVLQLV